MTMTATKPWQAKPHSAKQAEFLTKLVRERDMGGTVDQDLAVVTRWLAQDRTAGEVSIQIDKALGCPRRSAVAAAVTHRAIPESVPSSKFAILTELLAEAPAGWRTQEYLFFEVKKLPRKDLRVVNRLLGAPGGFSRTRLPLALRNELISILEKPEVAYEAAVTFGSIYQVCGRCAAELTDNDSRERGFGLHCWNLMAPARAAYEAHKAAAGTA